MIQTHKLSVSFGSRPILHDIDFEAEPSKVTVVVGPNGSGKTTLMKALCADHAYSGSALMHGQEIHKITPSKAANMRAVLPQATVLSFPFTVREVVALGLTGGYPGVGRQELRGLPECALHAVDLPGFGRRLYGELSGGEQQRVQLARVLCQIWVPVVDNMPRYLMLDEPVSSLDINHQLQILQIARGFADAGGGVIAILHDLNLAAMFADKIVVMKKGRIQSSGSPSEVLNDATIAFSFDCALKVGAIPRAGTPFVLPQSHNLKAAI